MVQVLHQFSRPAAVSAKPMTENAFFDVNQFGRLPGDRA
jgi:hypothetical protein